MRIPIHLFIVLTAGAWLIPNHYPLWLSAWSDGVAIVGLLLLLPAVAANAAVGTGVSWRLPAVAAICGAVVLLQLTTGKLLFSGDAVMAVLYIGLWLAAVQAGGLMASQDGHNGGLNTLMAAWIFAALLSVGIALVQWTDALNLGIYAVDLPPEGRPFGNVAQPNQFCTLCLLGLCGLLWLHQQHRVSGAGFWLGGGFLLLGMVASRSRTGWLQIGLLIVWGLAMRGRAGLRITRGQLLMLGGGFAAGVLLWPWLSDLLMLPVGRSMGDQMQAGIRLPYWWSMLDAIGREPLFGYGWQQAGMAQQRVAIDHPPIGEYFASSHNLVLDLLLWNGIPIGSLIVVLLVWWFIANIRACRDARVVWLLAAVGGVTTHGMLEYPLEYAYFLIPVGLAMGAVEVFSPTTGRGLKVPRWALQSFSIMLGALFIGTAVEYLKAEENYRTLRLESAHIGVTRIETPAVQLHLLTQLGAFMQFSHTEAKPGMRPEQLEWMHKVSERYGFSSVLFRYALAAGLNGQSEVARETLGRICKIGSRERCRETREIWRVQQVRYPQLVDVMPPDVYKN